MKKLSKFIVGIGVVLAMVGCSTSTQTETDSTSNVAFNEATTPHYDVVKRDAQAKVDGTLDEEVWENVPDISGGFHYPWEAIEAPFTEFKGYHDETDFYFSFTVVDEDVLVDEDWKEDESTVDNEDRVELFFAGGAIDKPATDGMPLYYGLEIDPKGRVHDYSIEYYRHFDSEWNMEGLETAAVQTEDGYVVEGKVPLKSLEDLKLITNNVMRAGVYRAEFSTPAEGEETPVMQWISWVDPKTPGADYHVDSSFGEFRFLQ